MYTWSQRSSVASDTIHSYLTSSEWQDMFVTLAGSLDQQHIIQGNSIIHILDSNGTAMILITQCWKAQFVFCSYFHNVFIKQEQRKAMLVSPESYSAPNDSSVKILSQSQTYSSIKFASVLPNWPQLCTTARSKIGQCAVLKTTVRHRKGHKFHFLPPEHSWGAKFFVRQTIREMG